MTPRLNAFAAAPAPMKAWLEFSQGLRQSGLEERLMDLVVTRASQINGCAFCIDMHWKDARAAGEDEERLYSLDAWRDSPLYDPRERAALALTEAVTLIDREGVPDPVWDEAAARFEPDELARLLCAITATNAWNRLNIAVKAEPGHYQAGMFETVGEAAG